MLTPQDVRVLVLVAVATVGISMVNALGVYTGDLWLRRAGERIAHDLRIRTYEQLQRLSIAFHDGRPKGDLVTRMTDDANRVGEIFSDSLGAIGQALLTVVGMLALSLWLDPLLGLVLATVVPLLVLVTRHFRREVRAAAKKQRARDGEIASLARLGARTSAVASGPVTTGSVATGPVVVVGHHLVNKLLYAALLGRGVEGALATPEYRPTPGSVVLLDRVTGTLRTAAADVPVVGG